jgi:hypothetical protein
MSRRGGALIERNRSVCGSLVRLVFVGLIGFPIGAAYAQTNETSVRPRPWVNKPSPALAAKLQHWRLKFDVGEPVDAAEQGAFPSFAALGTQEGTARLVSDLGPTAPIRLTPVMGRTRYVPAWDPRTDPHDKVVTKEIVNILRSREIARFIAAEHLDDPQLDIEKNFAIALVQEFDVALRAPRKKEHVWSINWRVDNAVIATRNEKNEWTATENQNYVVGYEAWGLFTRVNGALKPFRLAAAKDAFGRDPYYYVLAVGDLDGDGIDELVVRRMEFEAEEDHLELWAWEHGGPVTIDEIEALPPRR